MVLSTNDAAIYRVDNGAMVMNFDNMFFTKPATRKPQSVFNLRANRTWDLSMMAKRITCIKAPCSLLTP